MELEISKSSCAISFDKKKNSYLVNDSIFYSSSNTISHPEDAFHIDQSKFIILSDFNQNKDLKLYIDNEAFNICSKDTSSEAYLFSMFFNYLKTIYLMNLKNYKFQNYEDIKFNIKEYRMNLKLYAKNEIFDELMTSLKKNLEHFNLVCEIVGSKLNSFIEDNLTSDEDTHNIKNIMTNIKEDFHQNFLSHYNEYLKLFKDKSSQEPNTSIINENNSGTSQNMVSCDVILNNLDRIKENNLILRQFVLEMSKSFFFEIIKFYDSKSNINYSNQHIFSYFISKNLFGFEDEETQILKHEGKKLEILKEKFNEISSESKNLKKTLREIIYDRNIYPFFCFKCGNIMKRKPNVTTSSCKIDNKCTNQSFFYCYKCKIDFCTYCIKEIKDGKCGNGHLMFKFGNISDKSCINCLATIDNECYMCTLCEVTICINCYENINTILNKCEKCKCNLLWKRSILDFCEKCSEFSQNFWECFFCENSFCTKCYFPKSKFCGAAHDMEEVDLNSFSHSEYTKNFNKPNSDIYCLLHIMNFSCSYCKRSTIPKFKYCKRCHFNICESCLKN